MSPPVDASVGVFDAIAGSPTSGGASSFYDDDVPERLHLGAAALRLGEHPVLAGARQLHVGDVDVRRVGLGATGHPDPLELRRGFQERTGVERVRDPDAGRRKRDRLALGVRHQERDTDVAGLVILRAWNDRDVVPGSAPELLERRPPARLRRGCGRISIGPAATCNDEQARQHGQCRSWAHRRPSVAVVFLAPVRPGVCGWHFPSHAASRARLTSRRSNLGLHGDLLS